MSEIILPKFMDIAPGSVKNISGFLQKLNCNKPIIATGIEAIKAPKKGINTEKPTKTDSKAVYCNPNKLNIIAAAKPTIIISIDLPLT